MRKVFTFILRFKELFAIAIIALLIFLLHGCGNANASNREAKKTAPDEKENARAAIDTMQVYYPIIEKEADIISGALPPDDSKGWVGLSSIVTTEVEGDPGKWMRELGWAVRDLDGDNVLFIGMITGNIEGGQGNMIIAMYNIKDGKAHNLIDAGYRDAWYLMDPGDSFLELGSASAACSIIASYRYMPNETPHISCDSYLYTGLNEAGDHTFYSSYTPTVDPAKGRKLDWTWNDWKQVEFNLTDQTIYIRLTPFEVLRPVKVTQDRDWVNFTTSTDVKDFKVWKLSDVDYTEDGKMTYKKTEMKDYGQFKAFENEMLFMPFIGDSPQYAVSYVDMLGHPVMKMLMVSGMDGSLQLWDIP